MWKKINRNNLPGGVVVARRGSLVHSGYLKTVPDGMILLVSEYGREVLIEWPEWYIKIFDLLELPFEASAKDILTKEIANSASGITGIIIHPKLADRLIEEGAIVSNVSPVNGYLFPIETRTGLVHHKIYVSSDNMEPEQVIVF